MSRTGGIRRWATSLAIAPLMMLATPISSRAQFTTLVSFTGASGLGTVFKITSLGTLTILHSFAGTDGELPTCALVEGTDGKFYGTTEAGGSHVPPYGTVFKITSSGTFTSLHSFTGADGQGPEAALVQGSNGNYYGTTAGGGASNLGTVFKITSTGTLTTLHS